MTIKAEFLRWVEIENEAPVAIFELTRTTEVSLEHLYDEGVPIPTHPSFEEYQKQQASAS